MKNKLNDERKKKREERKKREPILLFSFFILHFSFVFFSCENPLILQIVEPKTIVFDSNGGSSIDSQTVYKGYTVKRPSDPSRSGYTFDDWYVDNAAFQKKWDFNTAPNSAMTLYAKWNAVDGVDQPITNAAVTITGPATGEVPDSTATAGGAGYTCGAVTWTPDDNPFIKITRYTASVTLTAESGYTFTGLGGATINANAAVISGNSGSAVTLSYTFAATLPGQITGILIKTQPANLTYIHGDFLDLSGLEVTLSFTDGSSEDVALADFNDYNISANPANGAGLSHTTHDGLPVSVSAGSKSADTNSLTVNKAAITAAAVTVTSPVKGGTPSAIATAGGTGYICGAVTWSPADNVFLGGKQYTATVTLTAESDYTFTGLSGATINANAAVVSVNSGNTVTLSYTFAATSARNITGISIKTQPTKLVYANGEALNLTGLEVTLSYDDGTTEDVSYSDFAAKSITTNPTSGSTLSHTTHDNQPVVVTAGSYSKNTSNLTVTAGPFTSEKGIDLVYIPAGTFMMGSPVGEPGRVDADETPHQVTLTTGFYMGKYEVTQEQYRLVMGGGTGNGTGSPSEHTTAVVVPSQESGTPDKLPVENVSWYDALVFCNKLSVMEGLSPAYRINGSTDPTDGEPCRQAMARHGTR